MTALERYLRLEALGLWRETPDAEPREVIVSFGKTTLVFSDLKDRPLGHWALGGIRVLDGTDATGATVYAMSDGETLSLRDREMVAAIAAVTRALPAPLQPPQPRRRPRHYAGPLLLLLALGLLAGAGPVYLRRATEALIPPEQETELGERMLAILVEMHGQPCSAPAGLGALARLGAAVASPRPPRVLVMDLSGAPQKVEAVALPGNILVIDREALETMPQEQVSGWILRMPQNQALQQLVLHAGVIAGLRYVLTGHFADPALTRAAEGALLDPAGTAQVGENALTDADWAAIRGLCR